MPLANDDIPAIEALRRQAETPVLARPADHPGVIADLAAAFADDFMVGWILREGAGRSRALHDFFNLFVGIYASQSAGIERPAAGGAVALWVRSENMGRTSLAHSIATPITLIRACGFSRMGRASKAGAALEANHPKAPPHDYLAFLGVRPEHQGNGLGSRLLRAHTDRLDAEQRPAFLETANPRTLPLYRSAGFEVTHEYRAAPDAPHMWALWREPREG